MSIEKYNSQLQQAKIPSRNNKGTKMPTILQIERFGVYGAYDNFDDAFLATQCAHEKAGTFCKKSAEFWVKNLITQNLTQVCHMHLGDVIKKELD